MPWYSDRSRYLAGYSCPWKRLIAYHCNLVPPLTEPEIQMGHRIHSYLETIMLAAKSGETINQDWMRAYEPGPYEAASARLPAIGVNLDPPEAESDPLDEAWGVVNAWVRCVLPWLLDHFEVVDVEKEISLSLPDDIVWMARPDLVLRHRNEGYMAILDFKSTRSKAERVANINIQSMQTIVNMHAVAQEYGTPCLGAVISVLQLGTVQWPTPITHAYYRPGQPPYVTEDWRARNRGADGKWLGKLYRKVRVADHRPVPEWVWSMPADEASLIVPIAGFNVTAPVDFSPTDLGLRYSHAIQSILTTEREWRAKLSGVNLEEATGAELSALFPRTFNCHDYNRPCEYMPICFSADTMATTVGFWHAGAYVRRLPHHPQEKQ